MRHGKAGRQFGRRTTWRAATVRDIAKSVLIHECITTTESRAKESRKLVDKLITMGKQGTLAAKRRAFAVLCEHGLVSNLFNAIAPRFKNRLGGYTRIIPLGVNRKGDNARLVLLELTEKGKTQVAKADSKTSAKDKKETAPVVEGAVPEEVKEGHAEGKKKDVRKEKKDDKRILRTKDKISKPASGGMTKIFRIKKPE
jgi:large subunit ribosomal protein L17